MINWQIVFSDGLEPPVYTISAYRFNQLIYEKKRCHSQDSNLLTQPLRQFLRDEIYSFATLLWLLRVLGRTRTAVRRVAADDLTTRTRAHIYLFPTMSKNSKIKSPDFPCSESGDFLYSLFMNFHLTVQTFIHPPGFSSQ